MARGWTEEREAIMVAGSRGGVLEQGCAVRGPPPPRIGRRARILHRTRLFMIPPPQASRPEGDGGQGDEDQEYGGEGEWEAGAGSVLPSGVTPDDIVEGRVEPEWLFAGPGMVGMDYDEAMEMAMEAQKAMGIDLDGGDGGREEVLFDMGGGDGVLKIAGEEARGVQDYNVDGVSVSEGFADGDYDDDDEDQGDSTVEWNLGGGDQLITTEQGEVMGIGDLFPFEEVNIAPVRELQHAKLASIRTRVCNRCSCVGGLPPPPPAPQRPSGRIFFEVMKSGPRNSPETIEKTSKP